MSDIKPGDLVMVVKPTPCCADPQLIGTVFTVRRIVHVRVVCRFCGWMGPIFSAMNEEPESGVDVRMLRKIEPPAITEGAREKNEVTA